MVTDILNGITNALYNSFSGACKIYVDTVGQNLEQPCFFVKCLNPEINRELGNRFGQAPVFTVQYIAENTPRGELYAISERMCGCVECIIVGTRKRYGRDIESEISDEVLTVTVTYDNILYDDNGITDTMQELSTTIKTGNDGDEEEP